MFIDFSFYLKPHSVPAEQAIRGIAGVDLESGNPDATAQVLTRLLGFRQAIKDYAEHAGLSLDVAQRTRDKFFAKALLNPDEINGLDVMMLEAINLKFIAAPLTFHEPSGSHAGGVCK